MTNISQKEVVKKGLSTKELLYSVDSLALKIPLDLVEITHDTLNTMVTEYSIDNGVLDEKESYKKNALVKTLEHYNVYFKINKHHVGIHKVDKSNIYVETLSIGINSKFLEERYFEGITIENINIIYTKLMSLKVFKCDFKTFLNGYATDYDIKKDEYIARETYKTAISEMHKVIPPSKGLHTGTNIFKEPTNLGLQWNDRNKSSATYPFMKSYFKELELLNKSVMFYNRFLSDRLIKDLARFEYNIKTKPIARKFKIKIVTFSDLLNTPQIEFKRIHQAFVLQNFKDAVMSSKNTKNEKSELKPNDLINIRFIEYMLNDGQTFHLILNWVLEPIKDKNERYRKKKQLTMLYTNNVKGKKVFEKSANLEKAFDFFGGGNSDFLTEKFEQETNEDND